MSFDRQRGWRYDEPQESHREQQRHDYEQHHDHHGNQPGPGREQYGRFERGPERPYMDHPHMHMQQHHHHHDHHHHDHHHDYYQEHFGHHKSDDASRVMPAGRRNKYDVTINDVLSIPTSPANRQENDPIAKMLLDSKGYLMLVRTREQDIADFINGVQDNTSALTAHGGYIIGFASTEDIRVYEENIRGDPRKAWYRQRPAACLMWFKELQSAMVWFSSAKHVKQPDFPNNNPFQLVAVPLNRTSPNGTMFDPRRFMEKQITILWTEYPKFPQNDDTIQHALQEYSDVASNMVKENGGSPFVATARYHAGLPPNPQPGVSLPRVSRTIKTCWLEPGAVIAASCFPHSDNVDAFYRTESVQRAISRQYSVIRGTSLCMTFHKLQRTR